MGKERYIIHVDMDAFFAAVEQRDNPDYRGKPVVVGADPKGGAGRGVVSTCSYEARKFGCHSAMPISLAYKKCPQAIYLIPDMEKYAGVSAQIFEIFQEFSPEVEQVSIDEAFLDITDTYKLHGSGHDTCVAIKKRIKEKTGLTASVGLAPTKMAAKIASGLNKPDGLVEVKAEKLLDFLWPLDVGEIWGIGPKTKLFLNQAGVKTIGDLAKKEKRELISIFGKSGTWLWDASHGIDESHVQTNREAKSISNELTFEKDTRDKKLIESRLFELCEEVSFRLRQDNLKCRTITLKIRLEGFKTYTRSITVPKPANLPEIIYKEIKKLYFGFENRDKKIRLVGVKASSLLAVEEEMTLFKDNSEVKQENIQKALDKIRQKFGKHLILRAVAEE